MIFNNWIERDSRNQLRLRAQLGDCKDSSKSLGFHRNFDRKLNWKGLNCSDDDEKLQIFLLFPPGNMDSKLVGIGMG